MPVLHRSHRGLPRAGAARPSAAGGRAGRAALEPARISGGARAVVVSLALVAVVAAAAALAACGSGAAAANGRLAVVAGENVWGDIAAQIGGARVQVTSLISDPNADPHLYQSSAAGAAAMARARVAIENGAGYDDFMGQLLSASGGHPTGGQRAAGAGRAGRRA